MLVHGKCDLQDALIFYTRFKAGFFGANGSLAAALLAHEMPGCCWLPGCCRLPVCCFADSRAAWLLPVACLLLD
jgi:hypothetical protein